MANINVNTTELKELLEMTPARQNIMLVGNHGIGKSEILTAFFAKKGMTVVPLFLGQMSDPGDLRIDHVRVATQQSVPKSGPQMRLVIHRLH